MFSSFLWVVVVAVVLHLFNSTISEAIRRFREGINRRKGPPTHPIPATGPIETTRRPKKSENVSP